MECSIRFPNSNSSSVLSARGQGPTLRPASDVLRRRALRLNSRPHDAENYEMEIKFHKPIPRVSICVEAPRGRTSGLIEFFQRAETPLLSLQIRS